MYSINALFALVGALVMTTSALAGVTADIADTAFPEEDHVILQQQDLFGAPGLIKITEGVARTWERADLKDRSFFIAPKDVGAVRFVVSHGGKQSTCHLEGKLNGHTNLQLDFKDDLMFIPRCGDPGKTGITIVCGEDKSESNPPAECPK